MVYAAAGTDTTATTVVAAILYMILYPQAVEKAQAELDAVIGKNRLPVLGDRPELPYVTAFLMVKCHDTVRRQYNLVRDSGGDAVFSGCTMRWVTRKWKVIC